MKENKIDVKELKQLYEYGLEYLQAKQEYDEFKTELESEEEKYKKDVESKRNFDKLLKEQDNLYKKLDKYEKLKVSNNDGDYDYDDYYNQYLDFTDEQIVDYFETLKKLELLKRKINKLEESINQSVSEFHDSQVKDNRNKIKSYEDKVLNTASKFIDMKAIEQDNRQYKMDNIKSMILNNEYLISYKSYNDSNEKYNYYCGEILLKNNKFNSLFYALSKNKITTEKISKNYPSTFEYFVKKLEENTGKKYKKVNIVTNETYHWHDERESEYGVYGATLLLPENIAEAFVMSETKYTAKKLYEFLEKHNDIILINDKNIAYYDGWCAPKFNETHRSKARKELAQDAKSNSINIQNMFNLIESDYFASGKNLIGKVPPKFVADAIIDTIEYGVKLSKLSKLEKIVEQQKIQQDAEKEYEELLKEM